MSIFKRPLKDAGSKAIEDAITKAICDLTGEDYQVNIHAIDFGNDSLKSMRDIVTITLTTSKGSNLLSDTPTEVEEATASPS